MPRPPAHISSGSRGLIIRASPVASPVSEMDQSMSWASSNSLPRPLPEQVAGNGVHAISGNVAGVQQVAKFADLLVDAGKRREQSVASLNAKVRLAKLLADTVVAHRFLLGVGMLSNWAHSRNGRHSPTRGLYGLSIVVGFMAQ